MEIKTLAELRDRNQVEPSFAEIRAQWAKEWAPPAVGHDPIGASRRTMAAEALDMLRLSLWTWTINHLTADRRKAERREVRETKASW